MLESLSAYNAESLCSLLGVNASKSNDTDTTTSASEDGFMDSDSVDLSVMAQLLSAVSSMDEGTQSELSDFMEQMRESFLSGETDVEEIAAQASDELVDALASLDIDLEELVAESLEMASQESMFEYPQMNFQQVLSEVFADLDVDGDGGLSAEELGISDEALTALDLNEDGLVSQEELLQVLQGAVAPSVSSTEESDESTEEETDAAQAGSSQGGSGGSSGEEDEVVVGIDTNGDGQVDTQKTTTYDAQGQVESVSYDAV